MPGETSIPVRITLSAPEAAALVLALSEEPGVSELRSGPEVNISSLRLDIHDAVFVTAIIELTVFVGKLAQELFKALRSEKGHRVNVRLADGKWIQFASSKDVTEESVKSALINLLK